MTDVIIHIKNIESFDWTAAVELWKSYMPQCGGGYGKGSCLSYTWRSLGHKGCYPEDHVGREDPKLLKRIENLQCELDCIKKQVKE